MTLALLDKRPFFEKTLIYGVQHGIINAEKIAQIHREAPKGMVQIARYFGTEFLRPELEKARERMVNLVSLYLAQSCGGDLHKAAESLRDNSFLSRSKGGSDMLKALMVMPENSHFAMHGSTTFNEEMIPLLAKWTQRNLHDYQTEFNRRSRIAHTVEAAIWFAEALGLDEATLREAGKDAEAVIRTGLLVFRTRKREMPDWAGFENMVRNLRKSHHKGYKIDSTQCTPSLHLPKNLPEKYHAVVDRVRLSVERDWGKILDKTLAPRPLFNPPAESTEGFLGRYFWLEDPLSEVESHAHSVSDAWDKATGGHSDDSSLLTLFLSLATSSPAKTILTPTAAKTILRKIQKSGWQPDVARDFIRTNAPHESQAEYLELWDAFVDESESTLHSDAVYAEKDALAILRRECNVK